MIWVGDSLSSGKLKLQYVSDRRKAADYVKMLNDLSLQQEGRRLCEEECVFQQDNAVTHNASITKCTCLNKKIRPRNHLPYSLDLSSRKTLRGFFVAKAYEGGRHYLANSELKNTLLDVKEKYLRFNFRNYMIVCLAKSLRLSKLKVDLQNIYEIFLYILSFCLLIIYWCQNKILKWIINSNIHIKMNWNFFIF